MNAAARTPESLSPRSDGYEPARHCRGFTLKGLHCKRSVAGALHRSRFLSSTACAAPSRSVQGSIEWLAEEAGYCNDHKSQAQQYKDRILQREDGLSRHQDQSPQHKDQAPQVIQAQKSPMKISLGQKSSIDTLANRIGLSNANPKAGVHKETWSAATDTAHNSDLGNKASGALTQQESSIDIVADKVDTCDSDRKVRADVQKQPAVAKLVCGRPRPETPKDPVEQQNSSIDALTSRIRSCDLDKNVGRDNHLRSALPATPHGSPQAEEVKVSSAWQGTENESLNTPSSRARTERPSIREQIRRSGSDLKDVVLRRARDKCDEVLARSQAQSPRMDLSEHRSSAFAPVQHQNARKGLLANSPPATLSPSSGKPSLSPPIWADSQSDTNPQPASPTRPSLSTAPNLSNPQMQKYLNWIPRHLTQQTTLRLINELDKRISSADKEGYIYMYWLTPTSGGSKPDDDDASSLLDSPFGSAQGQKRQSQIRSSEVLERYASQRLGGPASSKTILLKIGRTGNVHCRMNQWSKQCACNATLLRCYPYISSSSTARTSSSRPSSSSSSSTSHSSSSSPSPSPPASSSAKTARTDKFNIATSSGTNSLPRKVPYSHRVERLIQIELDEKNVRDLLPCEQCGKKHREWFSITASVDEIRAVDEVINRWVRWAEQLWLRERMRREMMA